MLCLHDSATTSTKHGLGRPSCSLVILTKLLCGLAIALGWNTRLAAFLLAGFTAAASLIFHMDWESHFSVYLLFSKNIAIFGGLLFIVGHGARTYSLDSYFASKNQQSAH